MAKKKGKELIPPHVVAGVPKSPGWYNWSEWGGLRVLVACKPGGRYLYVTPPGNNRKEVKITPRIAGKFTVSENQSNDHGV